MQLRHQYLSLPRVDSGQSSSWGYFRQFRWLNAKDPVTVVGVSGLLPLPRSTEIVGIAPIKSLNIVAWIASLIAFPLYALPWRLDILIECWSNLFRDTSIDFCCSWLLCRSTWFVFVLGSVLLFGPSCKIGWFFWVSSAVLRWVMIFKSKVSYSLCNVQPIKSLWHWIRRWHSLSILMKLRDWSQSLKRLLYYLEILVEEQQWLPMLFDRWGCIWVMTCP